MDSYRWLIYALLGALFAAVVNVMTKRGLQNIDFTVGLSIQAALMLVTLLVATTWRKKWGDLPAMPKLTALLLAGAGVAAGLSWFFGYRALQISKVAKTAPIDKLSMPLAVVLAVLLLGERPTMTNWLGIALMVAGAFFVAKSSG